MRARLSFLTIAAALAAGCAAAPRRGASGGGAAAAAPAAFLDVPVLTAAGGATSLGAALGRRPALVSFWAPWCEPCVKELPDLQRLADRAGRCGGAVLAVAVGEAPGAVASFTGARGLTFPQLTDPDFALADALGQTRVPTTVVLDAAGRVTFTGDALDERARAALAGALAGCSVDASP
jgi:thiol-disulfide isomerase/thioredoxin